MVINIHYIVAVDMSYLRGSKCKGWNNGIVVCNIKYKFSQLIIIFAGWNRYFLQDYVINVPYWYLRLFRIPYEQWKNMYQ